MNNESISINIGNLTLPQRLAIEDMLAQWQRLGQIGSSRWVAFFADGDGNFHPDIEVNTTDTFTAPEFCERGGGTAKRWRELNSLPSEYTPGEGCYFIDYDSIAWDLRNNPATEAEIG